MKTLAPHPNRRGARQRSACQRGFSLIEIIVVCVVLVILAGVSFPVAKNVSRRQKEAELRYALRQMRNAIDEHKRYSDAGLIPVELGTDGYPAELEVLVEPIELVGQIDVQRRFLRGIPIDPMTGEREWGLRSHKDEWDTEFWGGESVYDVYSLSVGVSVDGVPYSQW